MSFPLGTPELLILSFLVLFGIALLDIWKITPKDSFEKIVWTCVILFLGIVGIIIYMSVGRKEKFIYDVIRKFKIASRSAG